MRCNIRRIPCPMGWATSATWTPVLRHRLPPQWYIGREPKLQGTLATIASSDNLKSLRLAVEGHDISGPPA
jgi:hypothetical protein